LTEKSRFLKDCECDINATYLHKNSVIYTKALIFSPFLVILPSVKFNYDQLS